mmetsp:Transcript_128802/g.358606  ORF Transcript_128802/g.358606 Transcript_128802/m.358606 type:complete len:241 (-) Transcript_128802:1233-1955(-)
MCYRLRYPNFVPTQRLHAFHVRHGQLALPEASDGLRELAPELQAVKYRSRSCEIGQGTGLLTSAWTALERPVQRGTPGCVPQEIAITPPLDRMGRKPTISQLYCQTIADWRLPQQDVLGPDVIMGTLPAVHEGEGLRHLVENRGHALWRHAVRVHEVLQGAVVHVLEHNAYIRLWVERRSPPLQSACCKAALQTAQDLPVNIAIDNYLLVGGNMWMGPNVCAVCPLLNSDIEPALALDFE